MATKKKSGASKLAVWIIVGLLMFGMIGFGAAGFNGTQRSLGKVGDKTVSISSYSNCIAKRDGGISRANWPRR